MAHGTFGRARGVPTKGQGWRMPCGLHRLSQPVTRRRLIESEPRLRETCDALARRVRGSLYFPFQFSKSRPPRAAQAYLTKMPVAVLAALPELSVPERTERPARAGRMGDSELRSMIEQYAVDRARWYCETRGATEVIALGKPYDLLVKGLGPDRHVEVKGSSRLRQSVELTVNEVWHAHNHEPTDLVVVDHIDVVRDLSPARYLYDLPEMRTP